MAEKQKKGHFAPIRFLILTAACAMFLYSGYQLFVHWLEDRQSQKGQQDLIDQAVVVIKPTEGESEPPEETEQSDVCEATEPEKVLADAPPIFVDFETLLSENPNIVAWIYSEGTVINYPVVQGEDNMYYVDRLPDGQYNPHGSIFLDYRNLSDFGDFNSILYGHNMVNNSMFGTLHDYQNQEYYEKHPYMWIITPDAAYRLDILAGIITPSDSEAYDLFNSREEMLAHVEYALSQSVFDAGEVNLESINRIMTLSTCSYEYPIARFILIGDLVPAEYPENPESLEVSEE